MGTIAVENYALLNVQSDAWLRSRILHLTSSTLQHPELLDTERHLWIFSQLHHGFLTKMLNFVLAKEAPLVGT